MVTVLTVHCVLQECGNKLPTFHNTLNFHLNVIMFVSVSTEFLALMKKVAKSPLVMDVLNITNVQRQLERLADLLSKIQKALGEYLERERSSFPRYSVYSLVGECFNLNLHLNFIVLASCLSQCIIIICCGCCHRISVGKKSHVLSCS